MLFGFIKTIQFIKNTMTVSVTWTGMQTWISQKRQVLNLASKICAKHVKIGIFTKTVTVTRMK